MRSSKRTVTVSTRRQIQRRLLAVIGALLASAAVIAVVAAGYAADESTSTVPRDGGTGVGQPVEAAGGALVKLASWSGGGSVNLARPGKPTVVLAIAGWCSTCITPARNLKALHEQFGDRVNVIAVSIDPGETEETLGRFRQAAGNGDYLWGFDSNGAFASAFALRYLDTVIVLDAAGNQLHKSVRPSNSELAQVLTRALGGERAGSPK